MIVPGFQVTPAGILPIILALIAASKNTLQKYDM